MNYSQDWLERYKSPTHKEKISSLYSTSVENSGCGDKLEVMLQIEDGNIIKARFDGRGCVMSIASADMLCEYAEGKSVDEVNSINNDSWIEMFPDLSPGRYNCVLLALRAMKEVVNGSR